LVGGLAPHLRLSVPNPKLILFFYEGVWYVYMYGWRWGLEVGVGVDTVKMRLWTNFFINPHMAHNEGDAPSKGDGRSK
jgi:hypothetical protein